MEPNTISLTEIGKITYTPMLNMDIWPGALILCSWTCMKKKGLPKAMYLVDSEGDDYQFFGTIDTLSYEGTVLDLANPYKDIIAISEKILCMIIDLPESENWWNTYVHEAIELNLSDTKLINHALEYARKNQWPQTVINQILEINLKSVVSPLHRAKRLHHPVVSHEYQLVQHID